jgi:hypothetical protein
MSDIVPMRPRRGINTVALRWALFVALGVVAVAYFVMPVRAQEACETWVAEVMEDEGGSVLTAAVCTREFPDAWLLLTCHEGSVFIRYDLAYGAERSPDLGEIREVDFQGVDGGDWLEMSYQEMDGLFAASAPADAAVFDAFKGDGDVIVMDMAHFYPEKRIPVEGAEAALETLFSDC